MATAPASKKSDLGVRTLSAIVMLVVAGTALWLGGWVFLTFAGLISIGLLIELWMLLTRAIQGAMIRFLAMIAGLIYVALACSSVALFRIQGNEGTIYLLVLLTAVIATDTFAYFSGRTFGGPKIAPSISPSKTWAGLIGGMVGALIVLEISAYLFGDGDASALAVHSLWAGPLLAMIAQAGDFLESWVKRKAGVKDSGDLIPGHGGLFDRLDGALAVLAVLGPMAILMIVTASGAGI